MNILRILSVLSLLSIFSFYCTYTSEGLSQNKIKDQETQLIFNIHEILTQQSKIPNVKAQLVVDLNRLKELQKAADAADAQFRKDLECLIKQFTSSIDELDKLARPTDTKERELLDKLQKLVTEANRLAQEKAKVVGRFRGITTDSAAKTESMLLERQKEQSRRYDALASIIKNAPSSSRFADEPKELVGIAVDIYKRLPLEQQNEVLKRTDTARKAG